MKRYFVLAGFASLLAGAASAQANSCGSTVSLVPPSLNAAATNAQHDACQQAVDVFQLVAPQLGAALAGGNATLGQGGTLGGLGHFTVGVRVNAIAGDLPEINKFPAPRIAQDQPGQRLPSKNSFVPMPVVDASFGLFKGFPLGLTNVGGVDLLLSGTYIPTIGNEGDDLRIEPENNFQFGFGGRLGLLQESILVPGVSVTYLRRDFPTTTMTGTSSDVNIIIDKAKVKTDAWRIVASKNLIMFGLAVGYGRDHYDQSTTISGSVNGVTLPPLGTTSASFGPVSLSQDVSRNNFFADLSVNLLLLKLVGEIGQVSGGSFGTPVNTFSTGAVDDSRLYGSVGLRFAW